MLSDRDSPSKSQAGKKKIARAGAERGDARRARRTPHDEMARRIEPGDNITYWFRRIEYKYSVYVRKPVHRLTPQQ